MTDQIVSHLQRLQFTRLHPPHVAWQPAVNIYAYPERFEVCMDLAGVPKQDIAVEVSTRSMVIHGHRRLPDSGCESPACGRVLVMEIADGSFERSLEFPLDVDTRRVEARQENGWLWITLFIAQPEGMP